MAQIDEISLRTGFYCPGGQSSRVGPKKPHRSDFLKMAYQAKCSGQDDLVADLKLDRENASTAVLAQNRGMFSFFCDI